MNDNKKKVVIVDDQSLFRERLSQIVNYEPDMEVTGEAENTKGCTPTYSEHISRSCDNRNYFERVHWAAAYQELKAPLHRPTGSRPVDARRIALRPARSSCRRRGGGLKMDWTKRSGCGDSYGYRLPPRSWMRI
jgi:hypothetical protein